MVLVCVKCGSSQLGMAPLGHRTVPGVGEIAGYYGCRECGWSGFPIDVKSPGKFKAFLEKQHSG